MPVIENTKDMIVNMAPVLGDGKFIYCTTADEDLARKCSESAICMFAEPEGRTFILPIEAADKLGFDASVPMRMITLTVHSSLQGVGLTAAVAHALSESHIPCNIVAAYYHDHVFVPAEKAGDAINALRARQLREV